ncbi:hypothetical protein [Streptomyces sp. NPDC048710]|uniref:hypothetical protein n=1 Tax=Streptomyces sp. NPDC048710 TaxID=3365586 RepID=UPI00371BED86
MAYVPAKADARRVVLVGESAARGFLLDPGLTPADVLQGELADGAEPVQCVDLARTGAGIADLAGLVESLPPRRGRGGPVRGQQLVPAEPDRR